MISLSNVIKSNNVILGEVLTLTPAVVQVACEGSVNSPHDAYSEVAESILIAKGQAQRIIDEAKNEAVIFKKSLEREMDELCQRAKSEAYTQGQAQGYTDGYDSGFTQGMVECKAENLAAAQALTDALNAFEAQKQGMMEKNLDDLKYLALEIASKIIFTKITDDQGIYLKLVEEALENFRAYTWVDVYVSDQEIGLSAYLEEKLALLLARRSTYLRVRTKEELPKGTCIVETDVGVIDASVNVQLEHIQSAFEE